MTGDGALAFGICRWFLDKVTAASTVHRFLRDTSGRSVSAES